MIMMIKTMTMRSMMRMIMMMTTWRGMVAWSGVRKEFQ